MNQSFTILVQAINASGLLNPLGTSGPFTVFAPTNAAFNKLPALGLTDLLKYENVATIFRILEYHIVSGTLNSTTFNVTLPRSFITLAGICLTVTRNGSTFFVNSATITAIDIMASNGILHAIDTVLLPPLDLVETAVLNGNFRTLVTALRTTGFINLLKSANTFTVFAPNDDAFNKLPAGVLNDLLKLENNATLTRILQYHVTGGTLNSTIMSTIIPRNFTMLAGGFATVTRNGTTFFVNNATVTATDIMASNGIVHVIDTVLLPPLDLVETAVLNGNFRTLLALLQAADLVNVLKSNGPFTVFAPNDAAFSKLSNATLTDLLKPENKAKLSNILQYHVVNGRVSAANLSAMSLPATLAMLGGGSVTITRNGTNLCINDANVILADVKTTNGLIHVIDTVLIPRQSLSAAKSISFHRGLIYIFVITVFLHKLSLI